MGDFDGQDAKAAYLSERQVPAQAGHTSAVWSISVTTSFVGDRLHDPNRATDLPRSGDAHKRPLSKGPAWNVVNLSVNPSCAGFDNAGSAARTNGLDRGVKRRTRVRRSGARPCTTRMPILRFDLRRGC